MGWLLSQGLVSVIKAPVRIKKKRSNLISGYGFGGNKTLITPHLHSKDLMAVSVLSNYSINTDNQILSEHLRGRDKFLNFKLIKSN